MKNSVTIIGAGLAGAEACWQAAKRGVDVTLYEMKPKKFSPAHKADGFAELVCSNSLGTTQETHASGILKSEMKGAGSLIIDAAFNCRVPAGGSLAVDRELFSNYITKKIADLPNVTIVREEVTDIDDIAGLKIIATGPLTSDALSESIKRKVDAEYLYFYDAIAPIVAADSINYEKTYFASRYDKGDPDFLNCPFTEAEYKAFYKELINGDKVKLKEFEKEVNYEACMPIETLAETGENTLCFGPMKPVGLYDKKHDTMPYAVVQLRKEDVNGEYYNLVGFQTKLKYGEQKRIFKMVPGLENAEFARYGSLHRNTFINAPKLLDSYLRLNSDESVMFAGQITGVEGYLESTAMGLITGIAASKILRGEDMPLPPPTTAIGALLQHLKTESKNFQPSGVNFGLFPPLDKKYKKKVRKEMYAKRAAEAISGWFLRVGDVDLVQKYHA
jgi:methylenetetrahydrofolate--tRNA-(uracil-5-)-methyltransferase